MMPWQLLLSQLHFVGTRQRVGRSESRLSVTGVLAVGVSHWQYTTVPQDLLRERLALGL